MKLRTDIVLRLALAALLLVGLVLPHAPGEGSHSLTAIAEIASQHAAETARHGHAHEDVAEVISHAFHGHVHNVMDHDHNGTYLMPHAGSDEGLRRDLYAYRGSAVPDPGPVMDLERPPRA